jgi:hypothetical protein
VPSEDELLRISQELGVALGSGQQASWVLQELLSSMAQYHQQHHGQQQQQLQQQFAMQPAAFLNR